MLSLKILDLHGTSWEPVRNVPSTSKRTQPVSAVDGQVRGAGEDRFTSKASDPIKNPSLHWRALDKVVKINSAISLYMVYTIHRNMSFKVYYRISGAVNDLNC